MNLKLYFFIFLILVTVQQCLTNKGKDKNPAQTKVKITVKTAVEDAFFEFISLPNLT